MDVVGYCRFSSEAQRDGYSIEAQVRAITEWAAREGHTIKKFYIDEARSGTNDNREDFQNMVADAASGTFRAVVVHKLDRFARDRYDSAVYRHKLKTHGVRVISVLEPLDDSPESVMMEAVLEGMAEYYSRNLSREVRKGKKEVALKAQHNGGPVPYGYRVDEQMRYVPIPEEAAVIREIFSRLDGGSSYADVTRWAISQGLRTRRGSYFNEAFIAHMTTNTMLVGRFSYGLRSKVGQEPIIIEDAIEPIVDADVFWRVHNATLARKRGPRPRVKEDDYILTGYLFCAHCGSHLFGFKSKKEYKSRNGADRLYEARFYRCARKDPMKHNRRHEPDVVLQRCHLRSIRKDVLETFVFSAIENVLFSQATMDWVVAELSVRLKQRKQNAQNNAADANAYRKELEKVRNQKARLLDLYLSEALDKATFALKSRELDSREGFLDGEIKRLSAPVSIVVEPDKIKTALEGFIKSPNADSSEYKKRLLATFVDSIAVSNEKIVIYFKFPIPGAGDKAERSFDDFVRKTTSVSTCFALRTEFPITAVYDLDFSNVAMSFV